MFGDTVFYGFVINCINWIFFILFSLWNFGMNLQIVC